MRRRPYNRATLAVAGGALLALVGLGLDGPAHAARNARLRRMVVVGDSVLAGFANGGLIAKGLVGQRDGAAALLARRAGVRLAQPLMSSPGFPSPYRIDDQDQNGQLDAGDVRPGSDVVGFRRDSDVEVRNLAVPGEDITSVFDEISPVDVAGQIVTGSVNGRDAMKFVILGLPLQDHGVSQLSLARDLRPTFLMVWLGNNDVLGIATHTNPNAHALSAADFGVQFRRFLNALADTGASSMAVANLPDVTGIAALRRASTDVTTCRAPDNTVQPVAPDALLSIYLDPSELPTPGCDRVLDPAEQAQGRDVVMRFNAEIAAAITAVEQSRGVGIAPVDIFALFDRARQSGIDVSGNGSVVVNGRYLGGLFSLDGTHPTRTGHALIANAFIDAIDARFGETIPHVNVAKIAARDRLVNNRFRPAGEPPFGLIAGSGDSVQDAFDTISSNVSDFAKLVRNALEDFLP